MITSAGGAYSDVVIRASTGDVKFSNSNFGDTRVREKVNCCLRASAYRNAK